MNTVQLILSALFSVLLLSANPSRAEDTDIYSGLSGNANIPNVMLIVDNASNSNAQMTACTYWDGSVPTADNQGSKSLDNYMCALDTIVHGMSTNADGSALVKIGLSIQAGIFLTLTPVDDNPYTGSFPDTAGLTNREAISKAIRAMVTVSGSAAQGKSFQETWAYYTGGNGGTTNVGENSGTTYTGSKVAAGCQKNYNIFISGVTSSAHSATESSLTNLTNAVNNAYGAGSDTATALLTPVTEGLGSEKGYGIEWARFMNSADFNSTGTGTQNIITYSVAAGAPVYPSAMDNWETYIYDTAHYGGGKYFAATSYAEIENDILKILNEVQAVNSVFASSSLPVSVNAQGTYLNQIYMGMFRPDANGLPRWLGNLKQYQFGYDQLTQTLSLVDSVGQAAISSAGTGFISPNAISFWTKKDTAAEPDLSGGFWKNKSQGAGLTYDSPDGELVEKGGAAQILRYANLTNDYTATPDGPRKLYTYLGDNDLTVASNSFDTTNFSINNVLLGTGPRTVTSITSASKVVAPGWGKPTPSSGGTTPTISITSLSISGTVITATVTPASDVSTYLAAGTKLLISSGAAKYDCNPCTIASVNPATGTFTYPKQSGAGTPTLPTTATIFANYFTFYSPAHGLKVGDTVTISGCLIYAAANNVIAAISAATAGQFTLAMPISIPPTYYDTACSYTPNLATVTTSTAHGLATGSVAVISGAAPAGYNGSWAVNVTGANTLTYQYSVAAPLANFSGTASLVSGNTTRQLLMNWVRGEDNYGDEESRCPPGTAAGTNNCPSPALTIRPSVHGDVLHSRPTVINYGGSIGVVVYYGANDGVFRAINGNQTASIGSTPAGGELWGFVPYESFAMLKRQHDNYPLLKLPNTPLGIIPTPLKKDYSIDGSSSVYQKINADGTTNTAYMFLTMRRGGRSIYGLDVTTPTAPSFLWRRNNSFANFGELGQTWSQPKVVFLKGYVDGGGVAKPVLIFGGGYSYTEDNEPPTADINGRGIFIVDAATGNVVWKATFGASLSCPSASAACTLPSMKYSIPSDITLVDRVGNDGYIDRLYVGDVGGNIWRVDLEPTAGNTPDHWKVTQLAALGCVSGPCAAGTTPRKFFYSPDIVPTSSYDAILIGSGDREHPLYSNGSYSVANRFYMIKDPNTGNDGSNTVFTEADLTDITSTSNPTVTTLTYDDSLHGYYVTLGTGEKVVNAPLTVAGNTYFGTNTPATPSANSCTTNLGTAKGYMINPLSGTSNNVIYDGGGLPPSAVAGNVEINVNGETKVMPFCIGCGGDSNSDCKKSGLCGTNPPINVSTSRSRTYWYKETD